MRAWAAIKDRLRRAVQDVFEVPALYDDDDHTALPVNVRFHGRMATIQPFTQDGSATSLEIVEQVVFDVTALERIGLTPARGGVLTLSSHNDAQYRLDTRVPRDGPVTEVWNVSPVKRVAR